MRIRDANVQFASVSSRSVPKLVVKLGINIQKDSACQEERLAMR